MNGDVIDKRHPTTMCSGMSFYSGAKSSQKKELRLYLIPFNMSSAHECLKMFFFTSFLLTCNTPKMAMKMCSFNVRSHNNVPQTHTHASPKTHTPYRNYNEEEQFSVGPDKNETLMGDVGIS